MGMLSVADAVRPDAHAAVTGLVSKGIRCAMLTGDTLGPAAAIGTAAGLARQDIHASLLPEDKLRLVWPKRASQGAARISMAEGVASLNADMVHMLR